MKHLRNFELKVELTAEPGIINRYDRENALAGEEQLYS